MIAKIENVEIRGCEVKESQKTGSKYIVVRFEDETGKAYELLDRDMERQQYYKKGQMADLTIKISVGKFTSITITDMKLK